MIIIKIVIIRKYVALKRMICLNGVKKEKNFYYGVHLKIFFKMVFISLTYFNFGLESSNLIVKLKNSRSK